MDALFINLSEIARLLEIHKEISGPGPGYKHNVQVLNKSAIVLLLACWEAYVEDLAESAFNFMLSKSETLTSALGTQPLTKDVIVIIAIKSLNDLISNSPSIFVTVQGILEFWATHPRSNTRLLNSLITL